MFLLLCLPVLGQATHNDSLTHPSEAAKNTDDPIAILEVGAATNWNFTGSAATFAPNLAEECTPIEHWLELEAGVSPFYTRNSRNGISIFSSISHGPSPARLSSCSAWGLNGLT